MKNPLLKRLPRELKSDIGKYLVIFLFLSLTIALTSGFFVAGNSITIAYNNSFEDYNIEDGHFILKTPITNSLISTLENSDDENLNIKIYDISYKEEIVGTSTYRIFINRDEVNKISVFNGRLAEKDNEIAIDRLYAEKHNIKLNDTIIISGKDFTVCGLVAFSDYSALFEKNTNLMFNVQTFTVASVTKEGFNSISNDKIRYAYAWKYSKTNFTEKEKVDNGEKLIYKIQAETLGQIDDFVIESDNQAIHFAGDDAGKDTSMMIWLLYIVIVIMAFIFAITISNTIENESMVIGTLRASGFKRNELVIHYLTLPVFITLLGAIIGNILGYTVFKNIISDIYYNSYCLPPYKTVWNSYAFILTTIIPCILMFLINLFILWKKLSISSLKFLRRDLKHKKNKKVIKLPNFKFFNRFRLRIISQNVSNYIMMFIGILFANILLLFGLLMTPLFNHYKEEVQENMLANYQIALKMPFETAEPTAEKYAMTILNTTFDNKLVDEVSIYGMEDKTKYIAFDLKNNDGVIVSNGILEKYKLKVGDTLNLKTKYEDKTYSFKISGSFYYPSSLAVFMDIDSFRTTFEMASDYYTGYLSDNIITDIDENLIALNISSKDMTVFADQMLDSMGGLFPIMSAFAIILYMLIVYLLSKIIIEKNAISVSIVKILGYQNSEITKLYVISSAIVVILSSIISLPICAKIFDVIFASVMSSFSGWVSLYIAPYIYVEIIVICLAAYGVIGALQFRKIKRIPMEQALKDAE